MAPTLSTARLLSLLPLFLASAVARPGRRCKPSSTLSSVVTSEIISSSAIPEPETTALLSVSTSVPVVSTDETSTTTETPVSSSAILEPEISTTLLSVSSSVPDVSSVEASTTTQAPNSPSVTTTSSSFPSSTTEPTSTTPEGPPMTTITSCPPSPTVAGPAQCYQDTLPSSCQKFSSMPANFNSRLMSTSLRACQLALTTFGMAPNPTATSCFPTTTAAIPVDLAAATSTLASVYSCLQTANVLCSFNADCQTKTYPVDQVPTPTPSIGVDLLYDGSFESGTYGNWSVPQSPIVPTELSTQTPRTGSWGYHAKYANINGGTITLSRVILGIEPGRQYQFKAWVRHDNPAATSRFLLGAYPVGVVTPDAQSSLQTLPANTWSERTITFTATSSWFQLQVTAGGTVSGVTNSPGGVDNIWVDDLTLTRLN